MILENIFRPRGETISTSEELDRVLREGTGGPTASGLAVNHDSSMRISAVYAAVRVLSESLAQLPLHVYRRLDNGGKARATEHPLYRLLHMRPNPWQTSFHWRETQMGYVVLRGNAYSFINRRRTGAARGTVTELLPIHPDRVRVEQDEQWRLTYTIRLPGGDEREFPADRILHVPGLSFDGYQGVSPIRLHREGLGLALATERHGARLFGNGARPGGVLKHPAKLSETAHQHLRESFESQHKGVENALKTMILEEGMEWQSVGMTSEDAQFLETRRFQIEEIARIFRVPAVLLQHADKTSTFASAEQFFLSFVKFTLAPWLCRWEQALTASLLTEQEQQDLFIEFNADGMQRGDQKTRYDAYGSAITNGWMTRNEARTKENLDPLEGLDEPLRPLNMGTGNAPEES